MSYLDFDFPHTRYFESDLRELIKQVFIMNDLVTNFVSINAIKYANPIQWNITKSYEKNTVVIDGNSGVAYISVRPVPAGVALTREQYWTKVFDLSVFITKGASNFARSYEEQPTTTATMSTDEGEWVVWDTTLYKALTNIHPGDRYVVDGNIRRMTVEDFYDALKSIIDNEVHEREAGDDALELALNEETEIRGEADSALHQEIVQESVDRENADNALQDAIDDEIANRTTAVNAERDARIAADEALESRIISAANSIMKTIYDYGYESGTDITQYIQRFINDDNATQIYLNMSGHYTIDTVDTTPITGAVDQIKYFYKSGNCYLSGNGAALLNMETMPTEAAEMTATYSTGGAGYPLRWVHTADVAHTPNGATQMNACFIDNIKNQNDGFYHWNLFAQSNIYSNTRAEDCVGYLQAHVYGDNENWALATENILHINNEYHSTRGIEVSITGNGDVSTNGGKRIGIHIANNTTGSGFNSDYALFITSHSRDTGWKTVFKISTGYSDYLLKADGEYGCTYGIDLSEARINAAAIKVGRTQPRGIQFQDYRFYEDDVNNENCIQLASQSHTIATPLTLTTSNGTPVQYLKVVYDGVPYALPLFAI